MRLTNGKFPGLANVFLITARFISHLHLAYSIYRRAAKELSYIVT